jgi:ApaG protein
VCNGLMANNYHVEVLVRTQYLAEQSDPTRETYVFAYFITIRNTGNIAAQLISRHWIIVDAHGRSQEVKGLGVVGQQPFLKPGEEFQYQSGTPLPTPVGTMRGTYHMVAEDGTEFEALVPEFVLSMPRTLH